ncbi:hypothetical protein, partial [Facilibium subflavum]|uniref:hypothetical protein n=1 Tax=Facilibium subflavum TaxID=2219058 RepID=UPI001AAC8215
MHIKFLKKFCRVDISVSPIYNLNFKHNVRKHDAPHRTVLVDFPHTALQFNSLNLLKYKNHVLSVVVFVV